MFLRDVYENFNCQGLDVGFSTSPKRSRLNGLYNCDGLTGMLERKNCKHLRKVLQFLGVIVNPQYQDSYTSTTNVLSLYCAILSELVLAVCHKYLEQMVLGRAEKT